MLKYKCSLWIKLWILAAIFSQVSADFSEITCDSPWEKLHITCVNFMKAEPFLTWQEARNSCIKMNSDLLTINDKRENKKITPLLKKHVTSFKMLKWWIGIRQIETSWLWVDNNETYAKVPEWGPGAGRTIYSQDNSLVQDKCGMLDYHGYLLDMDCTTEQRPFICEQFKKAATVITSPKSTSTDEQAPPNRQSFTKESTGSQTTNERTDATFAPPSSGPLTDSKEEQMCSRYHYVEQILAKVVRLEHRVELLEKKDNIRDSLQNQVYACPDTWIPYSGSCYLFVTTKYAFETAKAHCLQLSAHLVHIENEQENSFLQNHVRSLHSMDYWIGMTDAETQGSFRWIDDNTTPLFTNWVQGNPNEENYHCTQLKHNYKFKWNNRECQYTVGSICERKPHIA